MKDYTLITTPNLKEHGGVSAYWNSLLPILSKETNIQTIQIGGNKKNLFGPILDQLNFSKKIKENPSLVILNPSLGIKSFFRDGLFAKKLIKRNIPFIVFFHGWNIDTERKIDHKYVNFFLKSFGKAKKIIVLSKNAKNKIIEWGYEGEIILETTTVSYDLIKNFNIEKRIKHINNNNNKIKILFLARLFKEKGIYELIEAFNLLKKKYENLELIIAGDGDEFHNIKKLSENDTSIRVLGHVEGEIKINCFQEADIYCLPSYSEGLPGTVLEAMAFALPVITTPVGGLKDFFIDKKMGYLVDVKDSISIEKKLERLILDKNHKKEIAIYNINISKNYINTNVVNRIYKYIKG